ncbi:hypothetical protein CJJ07_000368 [Candidozyma auris]|nr:hypothetical protein CJJ07_000368 [[Candida] auris]
MSESDLESVAQNIDNISNNLKTRGIGVIAEAYEQYQKEVAKAEALAYKGEAGKVVMDKINELAQIFAQVTQNDIKELPMFMKDSEALKKTAAFAALNAEHIRFGDYSESITVKEFVDAAKKYMNPDHFEEGERAVEKAVNSDQAAANELFNSFDWRKLGTMFYSLGYKPIQSQFLYGPLATQRRRLGPRTRNVDDTLNTQGKTTAQKVSVEEIHTDPEQSTSHMVRSIYRQLVTKSAEERLNFFVFFLNPLSFAQSVENLFYISFLVRDGKIRLDSDEEGTPYVEVLDEGDTVDDGASISHHIANFDHTIWRQLVAQYNITEPFIPHRDVPEDEDLPSTP